MILKKYLSTIFFLAAFSALSAESVTFSEMQKRASAGDVDAQFKVGLAWQSGYFSSSEPDIAKDPQKAHHWLLLAANKGDDRAQGALGEWYRDDNRESGHYEQARQWLEKSAKQGNKLAKLALADMYAFGQGIPQDKNKAMDLYRAVQGFIEISGERMQFMALEGDAASQAALSAEYAIGSPNFPRDEKLASYWEHQAANNGDVSAQFMLGITLAQDKNYDEAIKWLKKAQAQGFPDAAEMIERIQRERSKP